MLPSHETNPSGSPSNPPPQPERAALRCPRCDSSNTKFCYYNNYSLSQPRHFCKSCRRYWTQGGALRNVPIGGGSRKSKKPRRGSLTSPQPPPMVDFQLISSSFPLTRLYGGPTNLNNAPRLDLGTYPNPDSSTTATTITTSNLIGGLNSFNYPQFAGSDISTTNEIGGGGNFLASSIESLSSLNQELHWKLQQHRMSTLFGGGGGGGGGGQGGGGGGVVVSSTEKTPEPPIFFQNLEEQLTTNQTLDHDHHNHHQSLQIFDTSPFGGTRNGGGTSNDDDAHENYATRLNDNNPTGGYVLDKDGLIKFQQYAQSLGMKKI